MILEGCIKYTVVCVSMYLLWYFPPAQPDDKLRYEACKRWFDEKRRKRK